MHIPNINYTLHNDLCTGCGVCESACPSKAITTIVKGGRFLPQVDESLCKNDKGCHRCYDVCPGLGINLCSIAKEQFVGGIKEDRLIGRYLRCFTGHSNDHDIRYHSASGGMVSQFLIFLLEKKYIDGAVVTAFDKDNELMVRSYIAKTREEVLQGKGSKYAPVTLNHAVHDIKQAEGSRFVIVGLPCHIHGFRKLEAIDRKFREKVIGYLGLYCSSGRTFYLTEFVFKERGINKDELSYFAYRDEGCLGSMVAEGIRATSSLKPFRVTERFQSYYHPLRSFFLPRRCLFCIDHYAELADISFGDIHIEPYIADTVGINSLVVRKQLWLDWLMEAKRCGCIALDEISLETLNSSQVMAYKKKERNARFVVLNEKLRRAMPQYDISLPQKVGLKSILDYTQNRCQQFLGRHKSLWWLVSALKKDTSNLK